MSHTIWYNISLKCPVCDKVVSGGEALFQTIDFLAETLDEEVKLGESIEVDRFDFFDAFIPVTDNALTGIDFSVLEQWICPYCDENYCAVIGFSLDDRSTNEYDQYVFLSARTTLLNSEVLLKIDFFSKFIADSLGGVPALGEEYSGDDIIFDWVCKNREK